MSLERLTELKAFCDNWKLYYQEQSLYKVFVRPHLDYGGYLTRPRF